MSRASSLKAFRAAVDLLRTIDPKYSLYVGGSTLYLMRGPSHDDRTGRPLQQNIVEPAQRLYMTGGDW